MEQPVLEPVVLEAEQLSLTLDEVSGKTILNSVTLSLHEGEILLLLGPGGCGKSSLSLCLNGIYPHAVESIVGGCIRLYGEPLELQDPGITARTVGIVFQDPESQFCMLRVEEELAFCLENIGCPSSEISARIDDALHLVNLSEYRCDAIHTLSGGQKQRLALACALALRPKVLILDEPTSNLDPGSAWLLAKQIHAIRKIYPMAVLLIEHQLDAWMEYVDRLAVMGTEGTILYEGPPAEYFSHYTDEADKLGIWQPGAAVLHRQLTEAVCTPDRVPEACKDSPPLSIRRLVDWWTSQSWDIRLGAKKWLELQHITASTSRLDNEYTSSGAPFPDGVGNQVFTLATGLAPKPPADPILQAEKLSLQRGNRQIVKELSFTMDSGELVALVGPNGAGKSTLAALLAGLVKPSSGSIQLGGVPLPRWREPELRQRIGMIFQHPEHQFVASSVQEELAYSLRLQKMNETYIQERVYNLLTQFRLSGHEDSSPFSLSQGQKRRLSVASMLGDEQQILLCDEPTFGQDAYAALELMLGLRARTDRGLAVMMITHDMELVDRFADRVIVMKEGRLVFDGSPRSLWAMGPEVLDQFNLLPPLAVQLYRHFIDGSLEQPCNEKECAACE